ncbi:DUF4123 domain-containing protein [Stenotrophomonas sp. G4]|uniref:DUF4123 domain-containing protein n=1 Tax=Stenotrophomonas sp. G4 TaxID=2303750 RepID=UPI000E3B5C2F|nr:DUF4123 domain-containing protein [Stenotrophomonas sp. G4]
MQLDHRLFEAHQYALINPLQMDRRIALLWPCEPIVPKELVGQQHLLPYLLKLGEMAPDARLAALDETVQYARDHSRSPFSALLKCAAGSHQVRNHLARMMVRKAEGEKMLFRYYDPRVWSALKWILLPSQLNALLGPINSWTVPVGQGMSWETYESTGRDLDGMHLTSDQLYAIASLASVNKVIDRLRLEGRCIDDTTLSRRIFDELDRAGECGLTDPDDKESYAFASLYQSPEVHNTHRYQEALRIARLEPGAFRSAVSDPSGEEADEPTSEQEEQGAWQHG